MLIPPKFQAKIPSQYRVFVHGDRQKYTLHLKTNFDVFIFRPFWHFITKCYRYYYKMRHLFYYKMRQKFITKCVNVFIQNVTVYYKMQQFVQNETFITKCVGIHHLQGLMQSLRNCFNNRLLTFVKCFAEYQISRYLHVQS